MLVLPMQEVGTTELRVKMKSLKFPRCFLQTGAVCLLTILHLSCRQTPPSGGPPSPYSETVNQQRYAVLYERWRTATEAMPPYSKTTAYTTLKEFSDIVACGKGIVPSLRERIKENIGVDFVLSVAVIRVMGWPDEQFPTTDITQLRDSVLQRLENPK